MPALEPPFDDPPPPDALLRPPSPRGWRERAGDLADATGTTPARLLGGAALLAVAVVAGLWLTRPPAPPPEVSLPFASSVPASGDGAGAGAGAGGAAASATTSTTTAAAEVVVHVAGAVARPGVLHLPGGSRVVDAVEAAGGLTPAADGARINLAAPLADGERVYVPAVGEPAPPPLGPSGGPPEGGGAAGPAVPLDLNAADEAALDALPGVGPATAKAIVAHRVEIGGYTSVDQLLDVRGIGPAKLEELRPLVSV